MFGLIEIWKSKTAANSSRFAARRKKEHSGLLPKGERDQTHRQPSEEGKMKVPHHVLPQGPGPFAYWGGE